MARPINHDTGSSVVTGTWEAAKGAALGFLVLPVAGALLLGGGAAILGFGAASVALMAVGGALLGGAADVGFATPIAAIGALLGLKRGADKISEEKAAYQGKVMAHERQMTGERSMAENAGIQQGYQAGFMEGQQFAVNRIQQELQQQTAAEHHHAPHQQGTLMGQAPVEGEHVQRLGRAGHQHHANKTDMVSHKREQAASATNEVGG
jgi:hypothetical protein